MQIVELVFVLIGLILVVFGWIVPHKQSLSIERKQREYNIKVLKYEKEKAILDQQISRLYGPIASIFREQKVLLNKRFFLN